MRRSRQNVNEPETKEAQKTSDQREPSGFIPLVLVVLGIFAIIGSPFLINWLSPQAELKESGIISSIEKMPLFSLFFGDHQDTPPNTDPKVDWVKVESPDGGYTGIQKMCDGTTLVYQDKSSSRNDNSIAVEKDSKECK
jgi:hypothetical protein